jgi:uncharacterized protein YbaP (TraB family)
LQRIKKLSALLFGAIYLLGVGCVFAQPIYSIQRGELQLAILAGSAHSNKFFYDQKVKNNLLNAAQAADSMHIEWIGDAPSLSQLIYARVPYNKQNMRELIAIKQPPCLNWLTKRLENAGYASSNLLDLSPQGFLARGVVPVELPNSSVDPKSAPLDHVLQMEAIRLKKTITELEGWMGSGDFLYKLDEQEIFQAIEKSCHKYHKTDFFKSPKNALDTALVGEQYSKGDIDQLRTLVIDSFKSVGWPDSAIQALFDLREERFALQIENIINAKSGKKPLFVFGAAHLGGDTGIISLLEKKGYKVVPFIAAKDKP